MDEIDGLMGNAHRLLSTFSSLSVKTKPTSTDFTSFLWTIRNIMAQCNQEINGKESERKVKQKLLEIKGTENIVTQN